MPRILYFIFITSNFKEHSNLAIVIEIRPDEVLARSVGVCYRMREVKRVKPLIEEWVAMQGVPVLGPATEKILSITVTSPTYHNQPDHAACLDTDQGEGHVGHVHHLIRAVKWHLVQDLMY